LRGGSHRACNCITWEVEGEEGQVSLRATGAWTAESNNGQVQKGLEKEGVHFRFQAKKVSGTAEGLEKTRGTMKGGSRSHTKVKEVSGRIRWGSIKNREYTGSEWTNEKRGTYGLSRVEEGGPVGGQVGMDSRWCMRNQEEGCGGGVGVRGGVCGCWGVGLCFLKWGTICLVWGFYITFSYMIISVVGVGQRCRKG